MPDFAPKPPEVFACTSADIDEGAALAAAYAEEAESPAETPNAPQEAVNPAEAGSPAVIHPLSGEVALLDAPTDELAAAVDEAVDAFRRVREVYLGPIERELERRLDEENKRKAEVGEWVIEVGPPTKTDYDAFVLRERLEGLVKDGPGSELPLTMAAVERVVSRPEPALKVDKREVNKLLASDDERILDAVKAAQEVKPCSRGLKVRRAA